MHGNESLGSAGLVLFAIALTLILLLFLPHVVVIGILALLAMVFGFCSLNTSSGKLAAIGGGVLVVCAVLFFLMFTDTGSTPRPSKPNSPTVVPGP
jgi:hypothetical protein